MAENLNYDVPAIDTDVCYENDDANCIKYGRLYNWETAMTVCPSGWHLPDTTEWNTLTDYVGGASTAGTKLKANSEWNTGSSYIAGTDDYGFAALPGGLRRSSGFSGVSFNGYWWSATETENNISAYYRYMFYGNEYVSRYSYNKGSYFFSVRCLQDSP